MRPRSHRGDVTFPGSHGNRTRSAVSSVLGEAHSTAHSKGWGVRYLSKVRSLSFFFFPAFFPALFWLGTSTQETVLGPPPPLLRALPRAGVSPSSCLRNLQGPRFLLVHSQVQGLQFLSHQLIHLGRQRSVWSGRQGLGRTGGGTGTGGGGEEEDGRLGAEPDEPSEGGRWPPTFPGPSWHPSALVFLPGPCSWPRSSLTRILLTRGPRSQPASVWGRRAHGGVRRLSGEVPDPPFRVCVTLSSCVASQPQDAQENHRAHVRGFGKLV